MAFENPVAGISPIRVVLDDDQPLMRLGVAHCLAMQGGFDVLAQSDGGGAVTCVGAYRPDVTVLAPPAPGIDDLGALHAIRRAHPAARIVVLAERGGAPRMRAAWHAGAAAYLLKTADGPALARVLRAVHAGAHPLADTLHGLADNNVGVLSARELDVLRHVAHGLSNHEIGARLGISENTVKIHLGAVLGKLTARNRAQAVTLGIRHGMLAPAMPAPG